MIIKESLAESGLDMILDKILHQRGVDLGQYKTDFLKRRLAVRLRAWELNDYPQYARLLDEDPSEYAALFQVLSINVTEFFRDKDVFNAFRHHVISALLARKRKEIRVWSAGCATGEEAYSAAILLRDVLGTSAFRVFATDISTKAIDHAKQGVYSSLTLKNLPQRILNKYFHQTCDKEHLEINKEIRDSIRFSIGDLATLPSPTDLDAIFCRNVLMYFGKDLQYRLFAKFHNSLREGGYFVLGKSEAIIGQPSSLFETILPKERIYRKRQVRVCLI